MILTSGRMVPAMAMITASAEPRYRGSFLSVNSSVQQLVVGLAPLIAGFIMGDVENGGALVRYDVVGLLGTAAGVASIFLAGQLQPETSTAEVAPSPAEPALPLDTELVAVGEPCASEAASI
jgi:MFS family permease